MEKTEPKPIRVLTVDPDCEDCKGTGRRFMKSFAMYFPCQCFRAVELEAVTKVKRYTEPGQVVPLEDLIIEIPIPIREKVSE